jgi:hypothetical protein
LDFRWIFRVIVDETLVNAPKLDGEPEAGLVLGIKQTAVALAAPPV